MARMTTKPKQQARRCENCGKFLASNSTDTQCEACLARDEETIPTRDVEQASAPMEIGEEPAPPRPVSSWPPRAPGAAAGPAAPRPQVPPPAASSNPLLEPGIVIPRPSQLHPTAVDPIRAALERSKSAPANRSRWAFPKRRPPAKPAANPALPMQAAPREMPTIPPSTVVVSRSSSPADPGGPPVSPTGIVQPLAPPDSSAQAPPVRPRGIVLPLAAEPEPVVPRTPEVRPSGIVQPASYPAPNVPPPGIPLLETSEAADPPAHDVLKPTGIVLPLGADPIPPIAPEVDRIAERLAATPSPPAPLPPPVEFVPPPRLEQDDEDGFALPKMSFLMLAKVAIAIGIGLMAGVVVPFLLSR
jgi:hypothetical protein